MASDLNVQMVLSAKDEASKVIKETSVRVEELATDLNKLSTVKVDALSTSLQDMGSKAGTAIDGMRTKINAVVQGINNDLNKISTSSINAIADSFKELGINSSSSIQEARRKITEAYIAIVNDSKSSAEDIVRAEKAKTEKLTALYKEQYGAAEDANKKIVSDTQNASSSISSSLSTMTTAIKAVVVAFGAYKLASYASDATMAAARYETLGVVMTQVGKNAGYTSTEMNGFATALQKTGISMTESESTITKMAQAQLDLTKATELARIAQDAAVIGNMNSSEALAHMVYGIQSAQVEVLRTIGINVNFENSYKTLAEQLGKNKESLTESEKASARLNVVLQAGPAIAGAYEAAMDTAGKQLLSMKRYAEDLQVMLGQIFTPSLTVIIGQINETWKQLNNEIKNSKQTVSDWGVVVAEIASGAVSAMSLVAKAVAGVTLLFGEMKQSIGESRSNILGASIDSYKTALADINTEIEKAQKAGALDTSELQTRANTLTTEISRLTAEQDKWNTSAKNGEIISTAAAEGLVGIELAAQSVQQGLTASAMAQSKAAKDAKTAIDDQTTSEMKLKGIAESRWQAANKISQDKTYQTYLDNTTDSTYNAMKAHEKLVNQLKENPIYKALSGQGKTDEANDWLNQKIKSIEQTGSSMKDAKKTAEEYSNTLQTVVDRYNQLTMSADDYARLKVWETYQKEAAVLGENNVYLLAATELALKKIATDGEQAKAIKEVNDKYNELFLTTEQLQMVKLQDWFDKLKEKIGDNKEALEKLNLEFAAMRAKILYGNEKDTWVDFYKGKDEANDRANKLIAEQDKAAAKEVNKIWDKAWKNIESDFADTIYDMMDKGIDGFDDFFKKIGDMFKKLLAEMISAWIVSGLKSLLTGGKWSISGLFGSGDSATGTATSALSLASLVKGLADLPSTIASGLTSIGEALGLVGASAATATPAITGLTGAMELYGAEAIATKAAITTGTTTAAGAGATSSISMTGLIGPAAAFAVGYFISSGAFQDVLDGLFGSDTSSTSNAEMDSALRAFEAGTINLDKSTADFYKSVLLFQNFGEHFNKSFSDEADAWIAENQDLLKLTMAEYDKLMGQQQTGFNSATWDSGSFWAASPELAQLLADGAYIEVGVKIAQDATLPVEQKMYQLGFIASQTGWESEAVLSMIAEFKDQGVAWEDINNALLNYGATDADFYKRIYAEYHGDSVLTDLNTLTAALSADGVSEDVLKTIKYIYESNIPIDQMQALLEWAGLSSEEATRIVGQIDPSDEWKDLVIPVDAPESIPVDYKDMSGRASGGPVSAGVPYIIGEVGPELFVPQESGHILSNANMKKLMGMGIRGYADGTTDPLPGTQEWWDKNPPSDLDINGTSSSSDSSTYSSISEWLSDYNDKLKELLGTGTDLGDQLDELNDYYDEQNKYATELNASSDQIEQLQKDQQAAKEKILQDWLDEEISYYNQMMGLNTELGDSLSEISQHYETAIKEATDAGATTEQLAELEKAASEVKSKAIQDWLNDEIDYYNQMMGLNTELGDTLKGISEHYNDTIASATAAGATEEQLSEIRKAASEVTNKALQDWLDGETDYYNEMMGNTTALGKTLSEISKHYDTAIAEAKAAGATEEQLAELRKAASEVSQKAIQDEYDSLVEYYNDLMGIGTDLESSIADVTAKFVEYAKALLAINPSADLSGLATALQNIIDKLKDDYWEDYANKLNEYLGVSNDWMNQLKDMNDFFKEAYQNAGNDAALRDKILKDWANAIDYFGATLLADYQSQVNQWLGISETQEEAMQREIDSYFLMVYYFLSAMKAAPEVLQGIVDDYNKVTQRNKDTHGQMGSTGSTGSTGTTTTDDGFSDALSEFTSELESYVDELKSLVESIQNTIDDIKYSNLNPYLTTSSKLAMAQGDYQKLFAAAKTGTTDDVNKYLSFVSQYLESAQARYKSSTMYQQIYNQVMKDLGIIQGSTQTKLTKSEELLDKINSNMVSSYSVLNDIKTILYNIQHGNTQSAYAGSNTIDSYRSVASITTGKNDNSSEDSKKIVNLLEGIYMAQSKPKRVEIRLDSGKTLTGEMMAVADSVYVERSSRPNMAQRRIYQ